MNALRILDPLWVDDDVGLMQDYRDSLLARIYASDCERVEESELKGWTLWPPASYAPDDVDTVIRQVMDEKRQVEEKSYTHGRRQLWGRGAPDLRKLRDAFIPPMVLICQHGDGRVFGTPLRFYGGSTSKSLLIAKVVGYIVFVASIPFMLGALFRMSPGKIAASMATSFAMAFGTILSVIFDRVETLENRAPEYFEEMAQASDAVRAALLEKGWRELGGDDNEESAPDIGER